ncbi:hypothetical protein P389DRAFT_181502 [Cystobasidium minutum MCA 4210]|uniref:uncharacterized protein n=1 Tax=Cystobasidium minutum MCA 4210 TaxID=1397322 RepID=UPI0034CF5723|eukprot:jgi/Rhomi1/181502/fgenesh1_pg.7_\
MPQPKPFEQEEYDRQYAIVQDLKAKCEAVTAKITPLQRREADLRKEEYELWQRVRAIKRTFLENGPKKKAEYLQWELKQRAKRDQEERSGLRKKQILMRATFTNVENFTMNLVKVASALNENMAKLAQAIRGVRRKLP